MSIGTKIFELRSAKNLSQSDLADLLNVSRQSVSKWETDAAVPDLDKLIKLCDVFGVTLDELTCRVVNEESKAPSVAAEVKKERPMTQQITIGYILLTVSLIAGILIGIFAESAEKLNVSILIIISALACSLICLFVKQKVGYWCVWSMVAPISLLSPYVVVFRVFGAIMIRIFFAVIMFFVAKKLFAQTQIAISRKKSILVILGWIVLICLRIFSCVFLLLSVIDPKFGWLHYSAMDLILYIAIALLLTYTACYMNSLKRRK